MLMFILVGETRQSPANLRIYSFARFLNVTSICNDDDDDDILFLHIMRATAEGEMARTRCIVYCGCLCFQVH